MSVLWFLIPLSIFLAVSALLGFTWSIHDGQMDDLRSPAVRMLLDDPKSQVDAENARDSKFSS